MLAEGHAPHFDKPDSISSCNFGPRKFTNELLNVSPVSHFWMGKYSKSTKEEQAGIRKLCQHLLETPTQGPELKEVARKAKPGQARENTRPASNPGLIRDQHSIKMEQPLKPGSFHIMKTQEIQNLHNR